MSDNTLSTALQAESSTALPSQSSSAQNNNNTTANENHSTASDPDSAPFTFTVHFHPRRFLMQFLVHILLPFSAPLYPFLTSWTSAKRQGFVPISFGAFFTNIFLPACAWASVILWILYSDELIRNGFQSVQVAMVIFSLVTHRLMIAVKYAYMSTAEFNWYLYTKNDAAAREYMRNIQFTTGWFNLQRQNVVEHLRKAQARADQSLRAATFRIFPSQAAKWKKIFNLPSSDADVPKDEDNDPSSPTKEYPVVNGEELLTELILYCDVHGALSYRKSAITAMILTITQAFILPGLSRVLSKGEGFAWKENNSVPSIIFFFASGISTVFFFFLVVFFFFCYVQDLKRRELVNRRLGKMLIPGVMFQTCRGPVVSTGHKVPSIEVSDAHELESWIATRLVYTEFGAPEMVRMAVYSVVILIFTIALGFWLAVLFLEFQLNLNELQDSMVVHYVIFDFTMIVYFSLYCIVSGSRVNTETNKHRLLLGQLRVTSLQAFDDYNSNEKGPKLSTFGDHSARLDSNASQTFSSDVDDSNDYSQDEVIDDDEDEKKERDYLMDAGVEVFETLNEVRPIKYLGIRSDPAFATAVVALYFSGALFFVNSIYF